MHYTHNESIISMKKVSKENVTVSYRLFENGTDYLSRYSVLISMVCEDGGEDDFFISDFANSRISAFVLFDKLYKNIVLPCEVEEIYSDGFAEIL